MTKFPVVIYHKRSWGSFRNRLTAPTALVALTGLHSDEPVRWMAAPGVLLVCYWEYGDEWERLPAGWVGYDVTMLYVQTRQATHVATLVAPLRVFSATAFYFGEHVCGLATLGTLLLCRTSDAERWAREMAGFERSAAAPATASAPAPFVSPPAGSDERTE